MKEMQIWRNFLLIFLLVFPSSTHHLPETRNSIQEEERAGRFRIQPIARAKKILGNERVKEGIPDFLANAGGFASLAKIDYSAPPIDVFKAVGNSLMPIITVGLALIPGGALISGIVAGLWGIISPFFGGSTKSPMELMIEEIKDELLNLKNKINELAKKIHEQMRKEMDEKLTSVVHRAVNAEIKRNEYICNKYSMVSKDFSKAIRHNQTVKETLRIEMISYINDCDNFLKDTAEAFVYPEFAAALWIPSVITTLVRVAFLTEVANYGQALHLDEELIEMFWRELKEDLRRHFEFFADGVKKRVESFLGWKDAYSERITFTDTEYEACQLQAKLLYFDREMYPYGIPEFFNRVNENTMLKIADFNVTGHDDPRHIYAYYTKPFDLMDLSTLPMLNCMGGPERIVAISTLRMSLSVTYVPNKIYEIRIIYFANEVTYSRNDDFVDDIPVDSRDDDVPHQTVTTHAFKKITRSTVTEEKGNTLKIRIKGGKPNESSISRFEIKTGFHYLECRSDFPAKGPFNRCRAYYIGFSGIYVVEHVVSFIIDAGDDVKGKIVLQNPEANGREQMDNMFIFGIEIVVLANKE